MTTESQSSLPSVYQTLGGEQGVRKLVDLFYDYIDTLPEATEIRQLHAASLKGSRFVIKIPKKLPDADVTKPAKQSQKPIYSA